MHPNRILRFSLAVVPLFIAPLFAAPPPHYVLLADEGGISLADEEGRILKIEVRTDTPDDSGRPTIGQTEALGAGSIGRYSGALGADAVPFDYEVEVTPLDEDSVRLDYQFNVAAALPVGSVEIGFSVPKQRYTRRGEIIARIDGEDTKMDIVYGKGRKGEVDRMRFTEASGLSLRFELEPPLPLLFDDDGSFVLIEKTDAPVVDRAFSLTLHFDRPYEWFASPAELPDPENWADWFPWTGTGAIQGSVLDMSDWLDTPAGKRGRVYSRDDVLYYGDDKLFMWGVNNAFAHTAPEKEVGAKRAAFYAAHGINAVRLHKYADGRGWAGILSETTFTEFDPDGLDRLDAYIAELKARGIYIKFSPTFGTFSLGPEDQARHPFFKEFGAVRNSPGWVLSTHGSVFLSEELQDLQIEQMLNLLRHENPYTGTTYMEDPVVSVVELLNEQSVLFFGTTGTLQNIPTLRKRMGTAFAEWLVERYGSPQAVTERWGEAGGLNTFAEEGFSDESLAEGRVYPVGDPSLYDPDSLDGANAHRKARLLDTMLFLYELQDAFYQRYIGILREAGYTGEIVASNWQAGRAMSHYYNLHTDARAGIIDRHNYYNGGPGESMVHRPGNGYFSAGMQQVADRPFMLSEWAHVFPAERMVEGPAIIAAYGMGLQGWDFSYFFQTIDKGSYASELGQTRWMAEIPQVIGTFPALSRQVLRGDVRESDLTVARSVHVPSLHEAKLGFDDQVRQGYDSKTFDSKTVPVETLAVARSVIRFDDTFQQSETFDLTPHMRDGAYRASTGQLLWTPKSKYSGGRFQIDTPATQAVVGFGAGERIELQDVVIEPQTDFAAIYVTAASKEGIIESDERLILVTMARARNDGMKFRRGAMLKKGQAPIRLEPVEVRIELKRPGAVVHVLDHNGQRTGRTIPVEDGHFTLDGAATKTCYYELTFPGISAASATAPEIRK